jgi:hypothetical protein
MKREKLSLRLQPCSTVFRVQSVRLEVVIEAEALPISAIPLKSALSSRMRLPFTISLPDLSNPLEPSVEAEGYFISTRTPSL